MLNDKMLETLEDFSIYEGTEYGESVQVMLELRRYDYLLSEELKTAVYNELDIIYNDVVDNFQKVEKEETRTIRVVSWEQK